MRTIFSSDQIAELKKNPSVYDCTTKSVYYTYEFKKHALKLRAEGVQTKEIWRRSGFDVTLWKKNYFRLTLRDWKRAVERNGIEGLKKSGGIPFDRGPDYSEKDHNHYLKIKEIFDTGYHFKMHLHIFSRIPLYESSVYRSSCNAWNGSIHV